MLKIINQQNIITEPVVMLLGSFDCVHLGHRKLINRAKETALKLCAKTAIMTFIGGKNGNGQIYTFPERLKIFSSLKIDYVYAVDFDEKFKNISALEFIESLQKTINIKAYVCGNDFRFGKNALGDVDFLKTCCKNFGDEIHVVDDVTFNDIKVSTSYIKSLLKNGEIAKANFLLKNKYFVKGLVEKGRGVGKTLNFPTANININAEKFEIKRGVYKISLCINGKAFKGIANYGAKPTFGISTPTLEIFIDKFNGDLYGKQITVFFDVFLREIIKFNDKNALQKQLEKDILSIYD